MSLSLLLKSDVSLSEVPSPFSTFSVNGWVLIVLYLLAEVS
ncbi:Uncharacterised protein [Segatella copri]|nr:Uncharacterised protein [Segatella copri]